MILFFTKGLPTDWHGLFSLSCYWYVGPRERQCCISVFEYGWVCNSLFTWVRFHFSAVGGCGDIYAYRKISSTIIHGPFVHVISPFFTESIGVITLGGSGAVLIPDCDARLGFFLYGRYIVDEYEGLFYTFFCKGFQHVAARGGGSIDIYRKT